MTQRLFAAVVPPAPVVAAWDAFLEPRRDAEPGLRWTRPESWHLTCAFLPAVPDGLVEPLEEALAAVAARTPVFALRVEGAGAFPDPDHARALWLGVTDGADELARLARRCRNAAGGCGLEVEGGRFRAHLTLARTRPIPARRWLTVLDALPPKAWVADAVVLFRSRLLPGGAGYDALGEYPLAAG